MATLTVGTSAKPLRPQMVLGADAGNLREITVPADGEVLTILACDAADTDGTSFVACRVYGLGEDDAAEAGEHFLPYAAGATLVYTRDLGQQGRKPPAFTAWSVYVATNIASAKLRCSVSYNRNPS